jgi:phosphate acyltransferase
LSIVLDAMGGDHAPREIIKGALQAAPDLDLKLYLVGDPNSIKEHLPNGLPSGMEIVPASQLVGMEEKPVDAYRKKDSSIRVGVELVKEGRAEAFISAGNTGACVATCQLSWRQMPGIQRPCIASDMPHKDGRFLILDTGASPDADPEHLVQFALMGRAYAQKVMGKPHPRVHLLNIGEEEGKGNALAKQAFTLLKRFDWFNGNIEGKDMWSHPCDVVVCDAFVGNVVLKTSEGLADLIIKLIREQVPKNPIQALPYLPLKKVITPLKKRTDWAEIGGSPLLGLNGTCIISHGRSDARAIKNAILLAQRAVKGRLEQTIRDSVSKEL